jgi:hypothetical protein
MIGNLRSGRDSIDPASLKLDVEFGDVVPDFFGGYTSGRWADAPEIMAAHPGFPIIRFDIASGILLGDCLDIENGDADPVDAPGWTVKKRNMGHTWVTNYCSESDYNAVVGAHASQGVPCPHLILAGYPGSPGEGKTYDWPYVVGHQFADRGPYDETVVTEEYYQLMAGLANHPTTGVLRLDDDMRLSKMQFQPSIKDSAGKVLPEQNMTACINDSGDCYIKTEVLLQPFQNVRITVDPGGSIKFSNVTLYEWFGSVWCELLAVGPAGLVYRGQSADGVHWSAFSAMP